ncbi:MAG TPA: hypothetical protein DCQ34_08625 [Chitinophagaceae bacterium]|nr:hypothetical protein [Chitinophagaceae bacterium]HCY89473.1 hypothetical protein [Chitinophagaceae bacterium]
MKKLFFIVALTTASFAGFAQDKSAETKKLNFSVGVEAQLPIGDFADGYGFGIGGTVQADYRVADQIDLTLNAGYITFSGKTIDLGVISFKNDALGLIPVLAGAKYHFSDNIYASAQLGLSFASGSGSGSNFTYAPGIGFKFSKIDVLAKYTGISATGGSLNTVGVRAAYTF